jgi:hypothetical protein
MKNSSGGGFALGLFGTLAFASELRIFGGFTFVIIVILLSVFGVGLLLRRALQSGSDGARIVYRDNAYDWNAARTDHHGLGCPRS